VFDLIIKNGNIIDGTGSKPRKSDIGINGDKIISIGDLKNQEAKTIVDAEGLCVSPGFIDTHSHADFDILRDPQHIYGISQGVTTEILSPDGIGIVPLILFPIASAHAFEISSTGKIITWFLIPTLPFSLL